MISTIRALMIAAVVSLGAGTARATDLCTAHGCNVKWQLQSEPVIQLEVKIQVGTGQPQLISPSQPSQWPNLGYAREESTVSFEVRALDEDNHVCQGKVVGQVTNALDTTKSITVAITLEDGTALDTVTLEPDGSGSWTGTWPIPEGTAGNRVRFQFGGTIDDVYCSAHPSSDDSPVYLNPYKAEVTVFKVDAIMVIPMGMSEGDTLPDPVCIGAGAIASDAHQANVEIRVIPEKPGIPIEVSLVGGIGHDAGKAAKLAMGSLVATGGVGIVTVSTSDGGKINGVLTSSDVVEACTIQADDFQKEVRFSWDDVSEPGEWTTDPDYLPIPGVLKNQLRLRHHRNGTIEGPWAPLDQHRIRMFVEEVQYWDEQGNLRAWTNSPAHPMNLDDWAEFPKDPIPTGANGVVTNMLHVKNNLNLHSVLMVAYDCGVWKHPSSGAKTMGAMKLSAQPGDTDNRDEWEGTKRNDEEEFKPTVDLVGVDAITGKEVSEAAEETAGALVQGVSVNPTAKLIAKPVGAGGYTRWLTFSDPNKVLVDGKKVKGEIPMGGGDAPEVVAVVQNGEWSLTDSITATLTVKKGNEPVGQPDTVKLSAFTVKLQKVEFTSDHGVLIDYNASFSNVGTVVYSPRGWRRDPPANNPITHNKETSISVDVTFCAAPAGITFDLVGQSQVGALNFVRKGIVADATEHTLPITSTGKLACAVASLKESINWVAKVEGNSFPCDQKTGPHTVLVT